MWHTRVISFFLFTRYCCTEAFVSPFQTTATLPTTSSSSSSLYSHYNQRQKQQNQHKQQLRQSTLENSIATSVVAASLFLASSTFSPLPVQAYSDSDYASETVQEVIGTLKSNAGNVDGTFKAYETVAEIITEGKGVGGMVNYKGVQLERGYIADEDTSIYNPGLTLLTESEKERLVEAVIDTRKAGLAKGQWSENNEFAFEFLKEKLDPLHINELSGFLGFVPIYGAILYLGVLAVQQFARGLFPTAYLIGVVAFFGPILALVAAGPQ